MAGWGDCIILRGLYHYLECLRSVKGVLGFLRLSTEFELTRPAI